MPLAALLLLLAAGMFTLAEDLVNTSRLGQMTRTQEVYGLQINDSFLIKGPFWYPRSASRNYLLLSDSRGFATWGQLPDTLPTQHHFTARNYAQYFTLDTLVLTRYRYAGTLKTDTGGVTYVDTVVQNWCDSIANCAWGLTGNAGTTPGTNFIGTTDSKDLYFKTKNTTAIVVDTNQNVGIGTTAPNYKLNIIGSFSVFSQAPWLDGGSSAFVNENGFIDLFCSSTGITNSTLLHLDSTGFISLNCDNELTLQASGGNVGIGESYPTAKLHVVGKFRLVDGTQASGNVLTSDASGNATWSPTAFTPSDSVTIYALTPTAGTVYFCTDCTGNGFTGHPVYYAASMWRRWD